MAGGQCVVQFSIFDRRFSIAVRHFEFHEPPPPCLLYACGDHNRLRGEIDPEAVRSAIQLSETKYCSVGAMISKTAKIETPFEILPDDATETVAEGRVKHHAERARICCHWLFAVSCFQQLLG